MKNHFLDNNPYVPRGDGIPRPQLRDHGIQAVGSVAGIGVHVQEWRSLPADMRWHVRHAGPMVVQPFDLPAFKRERELVFDGLVALGLHPKLMGRGETWLPADDGLQLAKLFASAAALGVHPLEEP